MLPVPLFGMMDSGLQNDRKPLFLPDKAFQTLDNAYAWRGRVVKRQGQEFLGRLERCFTDINFFPLGASSPTTFSSLLSITGFVEAANNADPGQITTTYPHGLTTGDMVIISNIVGATGYNGKVFTITVIDQLNFTIGMNAMAYGAYVSGGVWISNRLLIGNEPLAEIAPGSVELVYFVFQETVTLSDSFKEGYVTNITQANPAIVTTLFNHYLSNGDEVTFQIIPGMTQMNGLTSSITVLSPTSFSCNFIDSTLFSPYSAGTNGLYLVPDAIPNGNLVGTKIDNITNITTSANAVMTVNGLSTLFTGNIVFITGVEGMPEVNNKYFNITTVVPNSQYALNATTTNTYINGGTAESPAPINLGTINYLTGIIVVSFQNGANSPTMVTFCYYPTLPVMGIWDRDLSTVNQEQTVFWDTKYAYIFSGGEFQEFVPGFTWGGTDDNFFWATNYRGITPDVRLFFETNFVNDANDPMRYYDGVTWNTFAPGVGGKIGTPNSADLTFMFQALILIPYYGRLVALNTWEGETIGSSVNIFNRCRFSQIGSPIQVTDLGPPFVGGAWRSDVFGKGGFIDAPTNESIVSAALFKNTLIVFFERSTWELRYVGEYGLPYIWNRISSDFGSDSTFASVVFDDGVLEVSNRAIINATSLNVNRIDLAIPDYVFSFRNSGGGIQRVIGERDFNRELVYWCYSDAALQMTYPNYVLMFNYRNNTYARFRDNVTFFGTFQDQQDLITWDSTTVLWDDEQVTWDDVGQEGEERVVAGNQQGFVMFYLSKYQQVDDPSLSIQGVNLAVTPNILTIPNHNLQDGEIIQISGMLFTTPPAIDLTTINDGIFLVTVLDNNNVTLSYWDYTAIVPSYIVTSAQAAVIYIGGGRVALFPQMFVQTKDFNPFQTEGMQFKLTYIDFLTDSTPSGVMSVILGGNASGGAPMPSYIGNVITGNTQSEQFLEYPYYVTTPGNEPISNYAWHRFFATMSAQFINVIMTYNPDLMNDIDTHESTWVLNAMTLYCRKGGHLPF